MSKQIDFFCFSNFWDWKLSWDTDFPDLTPCFEHTVLMWITSFVLLLCVLYDVICWLKTSPVTSTSNTATLSSTILIFEILGSFTLMTLDVAQLTISFIRAFKDSVELSTIERVSLTLRATNFGIVIFLIFYQRIKGIKTSISRSVFWIISVLCDGIIFQSILRKSENQSFNIQDWLEFSHFFIVIFIAVGHFYFKKNDFGETRDSEREKSTGKYPDEDTSLMSKLLFLWAIPLLWLGFRKSLKTSDLWELKPKFRTFNVYQSFKAQWDAQKHAKENSKLDHKDSSSSSPISVPLTLAKTFRMTLCLGGIYKLISDLLTFLTPQILRYLISFISNKDYSSTHTWNGFFFVFLLLGTITAQTLMYQQFLQVMFPLGMSVRSTLICAVNRKTLTLSTIAKRELKSTVGDISNLISIDVQSVMDLLPVLHLFWSAPLQISVAFMFLWGILGPSSLAGVGVMILLVPFNASVSSIIRKLQTRQMKNKDKRIKMMSEIISGIKSIKLYAWEAFFEKNVTDIRTKEIQELKKSAVFQSISLSLCSCSLIVASAVSFITYVLSDEKNVLTPEKAFVSLTLLNILQLPMDLVPTQISRLINACIAFKRLNKFMNAEEIPRLPAGDDLPTADPIEIKDGFIAWDENNCCLKNINLRVQSGELVAIVGAVGCGKTTLLSALLGETITRGTFIRRGTLAYVSQQAWIQNLTLKENILFGAKLDEDKYSKVIEACALEPDLKSLPAADLTEIGEKGVNLSGGQKQRVSLARAVYSDSDLYLLDDPLSAVDAHVGKHIFDKVIGPKGMLKSKTRIMVTHGINHLSQVDRIVVIKDGEICEMGTFTDLLAKRGAFADFFLQNASDSLTENETKESSKCSDADSEFHRRQSQNKVFQELEKVANGSENEGKLIEIEKMETGCVKKQVYWNYFQAIGYPFGIFALLTSVVHQGIQMASQLWLRKWSNNARSLDNGSLDDPNGHQRNMFMAVYGALGICQSLALMVGNGIAFVGMLRASRVLHDSMLSRVLRAPMSFFDTTPLGRIVNRFATDVDVLDNSLPNSLRAWNQSLVSILSTMIIISMSTPWFLAAMVPLAVLYGVIQRVYLNTSRQLKRMESVMRSPIYSHFSETLTGCTTIRAYNKEDLFTSHCEKIVDDYHRCYYTGIVANRWLAVGVESLGNVAVFFAGFFAILSRDSLDAGTVALSISCALQITQTLNWFVRMAAEVETSSVSIERIKEFSEISQEAALETPEDKRPGPGWPEKGQITFDSYESRYRDGLGLALNKVSFSVQPEDKVGIVGRTGAGKTSLTNALFRIVEPSGGRIFIDSTNIAELGLHDIRSRIAIIPQDPMLFSGSLRQNLDPFERYSDNQIWKALESVHLKSLVKSAEGLSYDICEGGCNFSAGQRQLLCLARALLKQSKILILDEATSCIDLETDTLVQETIRQEFKNSTVLTIAHRLNTVMDSTKILVLDKGFVKEYDTPAKLISDKNSLFRKMTQDAGYV